MTGDLQTTFQSTTNDVWIKFQAPDNLESVVIAPIRSSASSAADTITNNIDTLQLYTGTCSGLTSVNVFVRPANGLAILRYAFNDGTTYYLRVSRNCNCNNTYLLSLTIFGPSPCESSCNLSCNGSLDSTLPQTLPLADWCSNTYALGCWNSFWDSANGTWEDIQNYAGNSQGGFQGTPDYFNVSHTNPSGWGNYDMGVPANEFGTQNAYSGNGYAGLFTFSVWDGFFSTPYATGNYGQYYREYLQQKLCDSMIAGRHYQVTFSASLADSSAYATYLGVLFSQDTIWQPMPLIPTYGFVYTHQAPQWETPTMNTNKTGWTTYQFMYTPTVNCKHMAIGNFRMPGGGNETYLSNITAVHPPYPSFQQSYYYIDEISVVPIDTMDITGDDTICEGGQSVLFASIHGDTLGNQVWTSSPVDPDLANASDVAYLPVTPATTTEYYCTMTDHYGCVYMDTFRVVVRPNPDFIIVPAQGANANVNCDTVEYTVQGDLPGSLHIWTVTAVGIYSDTSATIIVPWNDTYPGTVQVIVVTPEGCSKEIELDVIPCCNTEGGDFDGTSGVVRFVNDSASRVLNDPLYSGLITGTTFSYGTIEFNGVFIVDTNITFSAVTLLSMGTNAEIDVLPGRQLELSRCTTSTKCDYMWEGIHVGDTTAKVRIVNSSDLAGAKNLILSENGGVFDVEESKLRNCVKMIVVTFWDDPNPSYIRKSEIKFSGTLLPAIPANPSWLNKPVAGIYIEDNSGGLTIGDTTSSLNRNTFENLYNGIVIERSNVNIYNNTFKDMTMGWFLPIPSGYGIDAKGGRTLPGNPAWVIKIGSASNLSTTQNVFTNSTYGLRVYFLYRVYVMGNRFTDIVGISADMTMNGNNIDVYENVINTSGTVPYGLGIRVRNSGNGLVNITHNTLTQANVFVPASSKNRSGIGILLESTTPGVAAARVNYNQVTQTRTAIWLRNVMPVVNDSIVVRKNTVNFSTSWNTTAPTLPHTGYSFQNCWRVFADTNAVGTTGTSVPAGDTLIRGFLVENTWHSVISDSKPINRLQSGVLVRNWAPGTIYPCNEIKNSRNAFMFTGSVLNSAWLIPTQLLHPGPVPTGNVFITNTRDINGSTFPGIIWYSSASIINNAPFTVNDSVITTGTICGQFYLPPYGSTDSLKRWEVAGEVINHNLSFGNDTGFFGDIGAYRLLRAHPNWITIGAADDTLYEDFFDAMDNSVFGDLYNVDTMIVEGYVDDAYTLNSSLSTSGEKAAFLKTVNDVYLRSWALDEYEFTPQDSSDLMDIALMDPFDGGEAVYRARIMLGLEYEEYNGGSPRIAAPSTGTSTAEPVKVYPNPASDYVIIEIPGLDQSGNCQIMAMNGQLVKSTYLSADASIHKVDTGSLPVGVYLLKVTIGEEVVTTKKLVIVRQ